MFKFKQCTKCGSKNKKHHEHCIKCGSSLDNVLKTSTKSLVTFLVAFLLLGSSATYAGYNAYESKMHKPANQTVVQDSQTNIVAIQSPEIVATTDNKQKSPVPQEATKATPVPKKTITGIVPSSPSAPATATPAPTTVTTPITQPAVAKLDEQTRIRLLSSANQWDKVTLYDWVLHPEDSNYCSVDFSVLMDIHNTYDYFTISDEFSDIKKAQDDLWKKGVGIEMHGIATMRNQNCYSANEAEYNANLEAFRIILYDYSRLLNIYDQKIKDHS